MVQCSSAVPILLSSSGIKPCHAVPAGARMEVPIGEAMVASISPQFVSFTLYGHQPE